MKHNHHWLGAANSEVVKQPTASELAVSVKNSYDAMLERRRAAGKSTANLEMRGWRRKK